VNESTPDVQTNRDRRIRDACTFVAAFLLAWLVGSLADPPPFIYDAGIYWSSADRFTVDGSWSLWNYDDSLRGLAPALLFGGVRSIGGWLGTSPLATVNIFNALLFAWIGTILAPRVAQLAWAEARFGIVRRLVLVGLLLLFWRGYLNFPLTDFPALACGLLALLAVARAPSLPWLLLSGVAVSFAINLRPAFILLVPAIIGLAIWNSRTALPRPNRIRRLLGVAAVVLGLAVLMVPQSIVSHRHHDTWSPIAGAAENLTGFQLYTGLVLQRYETYLGPSDRSASMRYNDPHTEKIVAELNERGGLEGYGDYLRVVLDHPIGVAGVWLRHLVNGMDQRYSSTYVTELDSGGARPLRAFGFLIAFAALVRLAWPAARRSLGKARWRYPLAVVLTCVTILPSAVETRFLLPLYLLTYLLVLAPGWPLARLVGEKSEGLRRFRVPAAIAVGFLVYAAVVLTIIEGASRNLE